MDHRKYRAGMGPCLSYPGGLTMRQIWAVACLSTILIAGQTNAADQAHKAEAAENKAVVLEQNSSAEGNKERKGTGALLVFY